MTDEDQFRRECLGTFKADPMAPLVDEYNKRCDAFDDSICTGRESQGVSMPLTPVEAAQIAKNARRVLEDIAERAGVASSALQRAITQYNWRRTRGTK